MRRTRRGLLCGLVLVLAWANPLSAGADDDCARLEERLPGTWMSSSDAGFFEEMAFSVDNEGRRFDSWLHHRPDVIGASWSLDGCRLVIRTRQNDLPPFEYIATLGKNRLRLRDRDGGIAIYTRFGDAP